MTWKSRLVMRESVFTAIAFTAAMYLYYYTTFWGLQDHYFGGILRDYLSSWAVHVELLLLGVLFGGLIGGINRITDTPRLRRLRVGQLVLFRTALYLVSVAVVVGVVLLIFVTLIFSWEQLNALLQEMTPRYTLSIIVYLVLVVGMINFMLEIERVIGPENLWKLFTGRYHRPRYEDRVFLFMDMKGSTTAAEDLGHRRYSELLQECYRDLTRVVMRYEAAIYQYVGDEVVLSWPCASPEETERRSVQAFFAYRKTLEEKRKAYIDRFGIAPEFRGGIDAGTVTAIEVGDVRRAIVFHGDVLNTAARLLDLCKTREEELVVSNAIGRAVGENDGIRASWHGKVPLRGKRKRVEAYSLQPAA
jgi:adenylate cyclase